MGSENPTGMAEAILRLFHDRELGRQMGTNAREYAVLHFSREKIARQYAALFVEVLAERKGQGSCTTS